MPQTTPLLSVDADRAPCYPCRLRALAIVVHVACLGWGCGHLYLGFLVPGLGRAILLAMLLVTLWLARRRGHLLARLRKPVVIVGALLGVTWCALLICDCVALWPREPGYLDGRGVPTI